MMNKGKHTIMKVHCCFKTTSLSFLSILNGYCHALEVDTLVNILEINVFYPYLFEIIN